MGDLSENFSTKELACKCGCGLKYPAPALITLLQKIREAAAAAINVSSGWRCTKHNKDEGSKVLGKQGLIKGQVSDATASEHTHGEAADIGIKGYTKEKAYELIQKMYAKGLLPELRYCYMIKNSAANIHVDVGKKRNSIWGGLQ